MFTFGLGSNNQGLDLSNNLVKKVGLFPLTQSIPKDIVKHRSIGKGSQNNISIHQSQRCDFDPSEKALTV